MPKKNRSKKGKGTQVSSSSFAPSREADSSSVASILKPATVNEHAATREGDCGSDSVPEWQPEDQDEDVDDSDEVNPVDCLREEYLCSFNVLPDEILLRFSELE
ncbi:hypothetical protein BDD12DRAFT_806402 [Trichophaea hybrida]|nr:hypothetical protein BDD12DRAFT_806402 [Trichophaea hybrida]